MAPFEPCNHDDFFNCPPTIQRKCFSSLERLRLAQKAQKTPESRPKSNHSSFPTRNTSRVPSPLSPRASLARRNSSYFKNPWSRKTSPTTEHFSLSDAQWYQSLPSKLQRRHFTEEERQLLSRQKPETVVTDAADARVLEFARYHEHNQSLPSLHSAFSTLTSRRSSISTFEVGEDDMDDALYDTLHCLDQDDSLDLASTLDDYHRFYAPKPSNRLSNHQPSFRRVMSLSSLPFIAATAPPPLPTKSPATVSPTPQKLNSPISPSFPRESLNQTRPTHMQSSNHKPHASTATVDPSPTHYTDPSARLKLRVYLASPQKFDEAIEFGFPSLQRSPPQSPTTTTTASPKSSPKAPNRPNLSARRFATAPPKSIHTSHTFLDDETSAIDTASLSSEDSNDECVSLPERRSPYTPSDAAFADTYLLSPSVASMPSCSPTSPTFPKREASLYSTSDLNHPLPPLPPSSSIVGKPILRKPVAEHDPLAQVLAGNREMTLRMTLTRPDLRADEELIYDTTGGAASTEKKGWVSSRKQSLANNLGDNVWPSSRKGSLGGFAGATSSRKGSLGARGGEEENYDPLALEQLPILREKAGVDIWDSLPPVRENVARRVWRKVSGKGV